MPSPPTPPRSLFVALAAGVVAYALSHALGGDGATLRNWLSPALYLAIAATLGLRAVRGAADRLAWSLLAGGVAAYGLGSVAYALHGRPGAVDVPWEAHALWLAFYAFAYAALVVLLRARMRALAATLALDGLVGALALAAIGAAFLVGRVTVDGLADADALVGLTYAGADVLLLALVLWAAWLSGRQGARMWLTLALGMALILAGDVIVDLQALLGAFAEASVFRALYPLGMLVLAAAAWSPPAQGRRPRIDSLAVIAVPGVAVLAALTLQVVELAAGLTEVAHLFSLAVLAVAFVRAIVTYRQLRRIKEGRRLLRGFEDAAIGMALVSTDGRWLRVNSALCEMLGRDADELLRLRVADVVHPDEVPHHDQDRDDEELVEIRRRFERRYLRPDGAVVETLSSTVLVDEDGDRPYFFAQLQDVTARNRATRHAAALAALGRMAIDEHEPRLLLERAMPVVSAALAAHSSAVGTPGRGTPGPLSARLPRRQAPLEQVLVVHRDAPADQVDVDFVEAAAAVLAGALDRADAEAETRRRALHDPLTGLANRTFLTAHVEQELAGRGREDGTLAVLLLDVDRFKIVNDTLGHTVGDELLREVATRLRGQTRAGDLVGRLGGDEFVVACRRVAGAEDAVALAERIVAAFEQPFVVGGRELVLGASVGVAIADTQVASADQLLRDADVAMYRAKDAGGAGHVVFDAALRAGVVQRMTLEVELRSALERGELLLHYQPLYRLGEREPVAFEALLRWDHPEHGLVPPADFVPVAEDTGMIVPIGRWVIEQACRQAVEWNGRRPVSVGVNLSARQLTPDLVGFVRDTLERHGLAPHLFCVEITETLLVQGDDAKRVLAELRDLGLCVALDDFGTGYSSLGFLSEYAIHAVKLDRSLIADIATSERARGVVRGVIEMAGALGLEVVAEGIEDAEQAAAAAALGCDIGQGWLYARALPAAEAGLLLDGAPLAAA